MASSSEGGFTLVEAITALAVSAIAAAGLMAALGSVGARAAEAEGRSKALRQAEFLLTDALARPDLETLPRRGETADAALAWTLQVGAPAAPYPGVIRVSVEVTWSAGGRKGVTRLAAYRLSAS